MSDITTVRKSQSRRMPLVDPAKADMASRQGTFDFSSPAPSSLELPVVQGTAAEAFVVNAQTVLGLDPTQNSADSDDFDVPANELLGIAPVEEPDLVDDDVELDASEEAEPTYLADRTIVARAFSVDGLFDDIQAIATEMDASGADHDEISDAAAQREPQEKSPYDVNVDDDFIGAKEARSSGTTRLLNRMGKHPLLTPAEEIELGHRIQAGDEEAARKMIACNLKLVVGVALKWVRPGGLSFEDLVQEGSIGLMRAAKGYDPSYGWRFSTYAMHWIQQGISYAAKRRGNLIAIPVHVPDKITKSRRAIEKMEREGVGQVVIDEARVAHKKLIHDLLEGDDYLLSQGSAIKSLDAPAGGSNTDDENMPSLGSLLEDATHDPERRMEIMRTIELMLKSMDVIGTEDERELFLKELRPRAPWLLAKEKMIVENLIRDGQPEDRISKARDDYEHLSRRLNELCGDVDLHAAAHAAPEEIDAALTIPTYKMDTPVGRGRLRFVFELRSGLNDDLEQETLESIGKMLGTTRELVRQIHAKQYPRFVRELSRQANGLDNLPFRIPTE